MTLRPLPTWKTSTLTEFGTRRANEKPTARPRRTGTTRAERKPADVVQRGVRLLFRLATIAAALAPHGSLRSSFWPRSTTTFWVDRIVLPNSQVSVQASFVPALTTTGPGPYVS